MSEAEMLWAAMLGMIMFNIVAGHFFYVIGYKSGYDKGIGYVINTMGCEGNGTCKDNTPITDGGKTSSNVAMDGMVKKGNGKKTRNI